MKELKIKIRNDDKLLHNYCLEGCAEILDFREDMKDKIILVTNSDMIDRGLKWSYISKILSKNKHAVKYKQDCKSIKELKYRYEIPYMSRDRVFMITEEELLDYTKEIE